MKMAKASQQDLDAAMDLRAFLLSMSEGRSPAIAVADCGRDGYDDLVRRDAPAVDYLLRAAERGNLLRVVWGLQTLLDPANEMVDPDLPHLEHHPKRLAAEEELQRLRAEVDQQRIRAEAAEADLRELREERGQ